MSDRLIRDRIDVARDVLDRAGLAGRRSGAPARAGRVVDDGDKPTGVPNYFAVAPIGSITGDETEGYPGGDVAAENDARDYVYVLGPEVPATGAGLIYYGVGDRWAANYGGVPRLTCTSTSGSPPTSHSFKLPKQTLTATLIHGGHPDLTLNFTFYDAPYSDGIRSGHPFWMTDTCFEYLGTAFTKAVLVCFGNFFPVVYVYSWGPSATSCGAKPVLTAGTYVWSGYAIDVYSTTAAGFSGDPVDDFSLMAAGTNFTAPRVAPYFHFTT